MKSKKTVTEEVLHANRANAQSSTGPRTDGGKSRSSHNALKHGILTRKIVLETDEERKEFEKLFQHCKEDFSPNGFLEKFLVEEIAIDFWKLGTTIGLETEQLSLRQGGVRDQIDTVFHGELKLPISDCEQFTVRAVAGKNQIRSSASRGPTLFQGQVVNELQQSNNFNKQEDDHLEVQAVLRSSLDKLTRYQSALKRDLYRAIDTLGKVKAERRERTK